MFLAASRGQNRVLNIEDRYTYMHPRKILVTAENFEINMSKLEINVLRTFCIDLRIFFPAKFW